MKAALFLLVLVPACMPSADAYKYACKGDDECGEGWVCVKGLCANSIDYPPCDDGRPRCAGLCCATAEDCVTSEQGEDRCCVLDVATKCSNGENLFLFDSCGNRGELVEDCGAAGCSLQTHLCLTCTPSCLMQDGVTVKECGTDSCDGDTCGDCGGVPANGVCADDYKCDCNANARCTTPGGKVVCCAAGESCVEGNCTTF